MNNSLRESITRKELKKALESKIKQRKIINDYPFYIFQKNDSDLLRLTGVKNEIDKKIICFNRDNMGLKKSKGFSFLYKYYTNLSVDELTTSIKSFYKESIIKSIDPVILYMLSVSDKHNQNLYHYINEINKKIQKFIKNIKYQFYIEMNKKVSIWVSGDLYTKEDNGFILDLDYLDMHSKLYKIQKSNISYLKQVDIDLPKQQKFENENIESLLENNKDIYLREGVSINKMLEKVKVDFKKNSELNDIGDFVTRMNFLNKEKKKRLFDYLKDNDNEVTKFITKNNKLLIEKDIQRNKINAQKVVLKTIIEEREKNKEEVSFFKKLFNKPKDNISYFKDQLIDLEAKEYNYEENVKHIIAWENFTKIIPESSFKKELDDLVNECSYDLIMLLKSNLNIFTSHLSEVLIKSVKELYRLLEKGNLNNYGEDIDEELYILLLDKFKEIKSLLDLYKEFIFIVFEVKIELSEEDKETKMNNIKKDLKKMDLF